MWKVVPRLHTHQASSLPPFDVYKKVERDNFTLSNTHARQAIPVFVGKILWLFCVTEAVCSLQIWSETAVTAELSHGWGDRRDKCWVASPHCPFVSEKNPTVCAGLAQPRQLKLLLWRSGRFASTDCCQIATIPQSPVTLCWSRSGAMRECYILHKLWWNSLSLSVLIFAIT